MKTALPACCAVILVVGPAAAVRGADPAPERGHEIAAAARAIFQVRCAACHGPGPRPKGGFGDVLDLRKVAADPSVVVPGKPEDSALWKMVAGNKMPPRAPLSEKDKETIKAWIRAGAPPAPDLPPAPAPTLATAAPPPAPPVPRDAWQAVLWAGRFHLLFLHFPIALMLAAAGGEVWCAARGVRELAPGVRFSVHLAAVTAVPTAALGWLYAAAGHGSAVPETLFWHRWLGTAAAAWAVLTALALERDHRRGTRDPGVRFLVILGALLVAVAAHFGGTLVNGDGFFGW